MIEERRTADYELSTECKTDRYGFLLPQNANFHLTWQSAVDEHKEELRYNFNTLLKVIMQAVIKRVRKIAKGDY